MATVKRKKPDKGYTYHEYAQKFRPRLLPKEPEDTADKAPLIHSSHPALRPQGSQTPPIPRHRNRSAQR